jgi:tetratricopeptide (TPR) repeat protein
MGACQLRRMLTIACVAAMALGGCKGAGRQGMTADNAPARLQEATRLAVDAENAYKAGNKDKALDLYRQSLAQSQELASVWNNLGLILMERQNYVDAVEMFKAAADLSTRDPKPYYNAGVAYHQQGWEERALEYFIKSLERSPTYVESLRGAIWAVKRLDLADHAALDRSRRALAIETDPVWRDIAQREQLRIEGTLNRDAAKLQLSMPVAVGPVRPPAPAVATPAPSAPSPAPAGPAEAPAP